MHVALAVVNEPGGVRGSGSKGIALCLCLYLRDLIQTIKIRDGHACSPMQCQSQPFSNAFAFVTSLKENRCSLEEVECIRAEAGSQQQGRDVQKVHDTWRRAGPAELGNVKRLSYCQGLEAITGWRVVPRCPTDFLTEGKACSANQTPMNSKWILGVAKEIVYQHQGEEAGALGTFMVTTMNSGRRLRK